MSKFAIGEIVTIRTGLYDGIKKTFCKLIGEVVPEKKVPAFSVEYKIEIFFKSLVRLIFKEPELVNIESVVFEDHETQTFRKGLRRFNDTKEDTLNQVNLAINFLIKGLPNDIKDKVELLIAADWLEEQGRLEHSQILRNDFGRIF